jgi:probable phosphoglycerate mutase
MTGVNPAIGRSMRRIERRFLIGVDGATEILLIRHADIYKGHPGGQDPPLSDLGRHQAAKLALRLRASKPVTVYTSPLRRAIETARAIDVGYVVDHRLTEAETAVDERGHVIVTEPADAIVGRMTAAIDEAIQAYGGKRIVMIGHGVAILHYLSQVMRLSYGQLRIYPHFTGINVVRALDELRMVGTLGDIAHLESSPVDSEESFS